MILVTGATGFVGAEILRRASRRGWRVRGLARHPERAEALGRLPHVELYRGDVTDQSDLDEAMEGVTAVVHLVGIIAETKSATFEEVHVGGTERVLAAAARAGVPRYVHMSALGVEAGRDRTGYFRTKWAAEQAVRSSDLSYTVFRPSTIFGRDGDFVRMLARAVRWSPVLPLPGGGRQRMQPVWVGDVAECFLQAARVDATPRDTYEVAGPEVLTLADLAAALARAMNVRPRLVVPLPMALVRAGAALVEALPVPAPVTREQLVMLELESVADPAAVDGLRADFEIEHARLEDKAPAWTRKAAV